MSDSEEVIEDVDVIDVVALPEDAGQRFDKFLALRCADLSRSRLKTLILGDNVLLNGAVCNDVSLKVKEGDKVVITVPPLEDSIPTAENIPLDIVYEDEAMLVINKPAGMVVHPGAGNQSGTLVNALLHHCADSLSGIGGVRRPGIVHRLDKDTSGLMVAAKSDKAHKRLAAQLADRSLHRHYYALVWRVPTLAKDKIDSPIGRHQTHRLKMMANARDGRPSVTRYNVVERYGEAAALVECVLETGRTHQIRVHMEMAGHPLIGDPLYGIQPTAAQALLRKGDYSPEAAQAVMNFPRQALHAFQIGFIHPLTEEEMSFEAPLPQDLLDLISILKQ